MNDIRSNKIEKINFYNLNKVKPKSKRFLYKLFAYKRQ
jgi:hypothetical protein